MKPISNKSIIFKTRDELLRVRIFQIAYFEADRSYTHLYLTSGQDFLFTTNLGTIENILQNQLAEFSPLFIRIGKSLIVNRFYILHMNVAKQKLKLGPFGERIFELNVSKDALRGLKESFEKKLLIKQE